MFEDIDLKAIQEENARELVKRLLNTIEELSAESTRFAGGDSTLAG